MRMSDGSSDVCSSDLLFVKIGFLHCAASRSHAGMAASGTVGPKLAVRRDVLRLLLDHLQPAIERLAAIFQHKTLADRKSVVSGKSVYVRVDLGGRRIIKTTI